MENNLDVKHLIGEWRAVNSLEWWMFPEITTDFTKYTPFILMTYSLSPCFLEDPFVTLIVD